MSDQPCKIYLRDQDHCREIPARGETLRDALLAAGVQLQSACAGNGHCGRCLVVVDEQSPFALTVAEQTKLSPRQMEEGLRLACQLRLEATSAVSALHVSLPPQAGQTRWRAMREDEYCSLDAFLPAASFPAGYGVAIDLGTTHIRLTLLDLVSGQRLAGQTGLNPQLDFGADVLNRLMAAAESPSIATELRRRVVWAIAAALKTLTEQTGVNRREILQLAIVGNTAMLTLLAGLDPRPLMSPENWSSRLDCTAVDDGLLSTAWHLPSPATIRLIQPLGGFVGSDLLAGILATRLIEQAAGSLLIDFGTNSEMALWDGMTLHVTSAAGGPAFEGSGISCGMAAEAGAVFRLSDQDGPSFELSVLGGGEPRGLCGSGLVDAIAWLRRHGKLDAVGRFSHELADGFILARHDRDIVLAGRDIDVFQRAKAAIAAGSRWLCQQADMPLADLKHVYVCGAFGNWLNVDSARAVGLLPTFGEVTLQANTALAGCEMLLSPRCQTRADAILALAKVYNLASEPAFEAWYMENLLLDPIRG